MSVCMCFCIDKESIRESKERREREQQAKGDKGESSIVECTFVSLVEKIEIKCCVYVLRAVCCVLMCGWVRFRPFAE
jgi:hypothetical protein